jgi:multisubunit Na+/H+ antiporter MnhB subunit
VVAGCYLLPLLGSRERRARLWGLAPAAAVGVVVTLVWNEIVGDLWRTDSTYFGIRPEPSARRHDLLTAPWHFTADAVRTVPDQFWEWLKGLWGVGPSVTHWPGVVIAVGVLLFIAVSLQHDRDEPRRLDFPQIGLLALLFVIGTTLVFAANWIYWTTPGDDTVNGVQARYFVPLLILLPLMIGTPRLRVLSSRDTRMPLAVLLVPFFILFAVTVTFRMH